MTTHVTPLSFASWSASEAQARDRLSRWTQTVSIADWSGPGPCPAISLRPLPEHDPILGPDEVMRLAFDWSGARLWLDLPPSALDRWASLSLGAQQWLGLDGFWREAALEAATAGLTGALSAAGRGQARFTGATEALPAKPASARHSCRVVAGFDGSDEQLVAVLHTDTLGLLLVAGLITDSSPSAPAHDALDGAPHLPVHWHLCLGETRLPVDQLQGLKRGDVVFVAQAFIDADMRILLRCDAPSGHSLAALAQLDQLTLTLLEAPRAMDTTPNNNHPDAPEQHDTVETVTPVQRIPVRLSFDVGHKTVTLQELQAMQAGSTLTLDRPASQYVTIRANGAIIGNGHLVEIDNRLGISVDSIAASAAVPGSSGNI